MNDLRADSIPIRSAALLLMLVPLLVACEPRPAASTPAVALVRPTLTLDAGSGRVLVPASTLVERGGIPGVFVLTPEQDARFRMVRTGKIVNGRVEILSGLSGNETLVGGELRAVHDGSRIASP